MTVTVNTLGPNSAEIVVINEATALPAMNAVETFITSKGWTREASLGNTYERIYSAANLTTGTKFIKINALDLHIEHAESYSGTTTVTATNPAFRMVNNDHLTYGRNLYADSNTSSNATGVGILLQDASTDDASSVNLTFPAGLPETLYPGQIARLVSRGSSGVWIDCIVNSQNNATGVVNIKRFGIGPDNLNGNLSDWSLLTHQIRYNTGTPSYIYVSASARHIAIQVKYNDGSWGDWHAIMETENPTNQAVPSILTTGFMISNSGYTNNMNAISANSGNFISDNTIAPSLTSIYGSFRLWCGPYSQPRSRLNRTGVTASRFSKISTPLGEAGPVGSQKRFNLGFTDSTGSMRYFIENIVYYKGMADVIPATPEITTEKQWAFSGVAVTDLTANATWTDLSINTWPGAKINTTPSSTQTPWSNTDNYRWASVREQSSWTPHVPTLLGRIYGIKFVTSGLPAGNILSIKVDSNGFADDSGIAQDHLVMNYQSQFTASSKQGTTLIEVRGNPLGSADQATIRQSESASVAFPK